jgi:uncharacterized protein YaaN involved in tellurite resistance
MQTQTNEQTGLNTQPTLDASFRPTEENALTVPAQTSLATAPQTSLSAIPSDAQNPLVTQMGNGDYEPETNLTQQDLARIDQIVRQVRTLDTATTMSFGMEPQTKFNRQLDDLLAGMTMQQAGMAGELVLRLRQEFQSMKLPDVKKELEGKGVGNIPVIGSFFSALRHFIAMRQSVLSNLEKIEGSARGLLAKLEANNRKLDQLIEATLQNQRELRLWQIAGQRILKMARVEHESMRQEAIRTGERERFSRLRNFGERITAFETRLLRMRIALGDSENAVPQTEMVQEAAKIEAMNIVNAILYDLPGIKGTIIRLGALNNINKAAEGSAAAADLSRQIREIGAQAMQETYVKAKASQGRGLEDVVSLAAATDKLLETMAMGLRLDEENRMKREQAHQELTRVREKLTDGLRQHAEQVQNTSLLSQSNGAAA